MAWVEQTPSAPPNWQSGLIDTAMRCLILEENIEPVLEEKIHGVGDVLQLFTLTLNRKDRREGMSKHTQVAGLRVSRSVG